MGGQVDTPIGVEGDVAAAGDGDDFGGHGWLVVWEIGRLVVWGFFEEFRSLGD